MSINPTPFFTATALGARQKRAQSPLAALLAPALGVSLTLCAPAFAAGPQAQPPAAPWRHAVAAQDELARMDDRLYGIALHWSNDWPIAPEDAAYLQQKQKVAAAKDVNKRDWLDWLYIATAEAQRHNFTTARSYITKSNELYHKNNYTYILLSMISTYESKFDEAKIDAENAVAQAEIHISPITPASEIAAARSFRIAAQSEINFLHAASSIEFLNHAIPIYRKEIQHAPQNLFWRQELIHTLFMKTRITLALPRLPDEKRTSDAKIIAEEARSEINALIALSKGEVQNNRFILSALTQQDELFAHQEGDFDKFLQFSQESRKIINSMIAADPTSSACQLLSLRALIRSADEAVKNNQESQAAEIMSSITKTLGALTKNKWGNPETKGLISQYHRISGDIYVKIKNTASAKNAYQASLDILLTMQKDGAGQPHHQYYIDSLRKTLDALPR